LVPKEGIGKAPSHVSDSEEAQVRLCFAETNIELKNGVHTAALNVLCFCLTLNGRTFEVLKEPDTANAC